MKSSCRVSSLIGDFLDFQKIHATDIALDLVNAEVDPLVSQALVMNQAYAEQYEVQFSYQPGAPGALATLDANRFLQVMANLLSNAAKFSPPAAVVTIVSDLRHQEIRISVANRGPMIPETARAKIFDKFTQVDSSLNRRHRGSGLGLAISKSLVAKMGGRIDYRSDPNETVFYFDLPLSASTPGGPHA